MKDLMLRIKDKATINQLLKTGKISEKDKAIIKLALKSEPDVCPYPPVNPSIKLYRELVGRFGRYHSGGLIVYELGFSEFNEIARNSNSKSLI